MLFPPYPNQLYSGITTTTIGGDVESMSIGITSRKSARSTSLEQLMAHAHNAL